MKLLNADATAQFGFRFSFLCMGINYKNEKKVGMAALQQANNVNNVGLYWFMSAYVA